MDNVIEIGIDRKGNADMFDTDPDSDPEKKHCRCYHATSKTLRMS